MLHFLLKPAKAVLLLSLIDEGRGLLLENQGLNELLNSENMTIVSKLLLASLLGGTVGFERDMHGRAAGLRTNILVCAGSTLFMIISEIIANRVNATAVGRFADPGRIAAQIITGIGFIGAGAIIKDGFNIRGLTTAACLWLVAGLGMAIGAGLYMLGICATFIAMISLVLLKNLENIYPRDSYRTLVMDVPNEMDLYEIIKTMKTFNCLKILYFDFERNFDTDVTTVKLTMRLFHKGITDNMLQPIIRAFKDAKIPLKRIKWDHNY